MTTPITNPGALADQEAAAVRELNAAVDAARDAGLGDVTTGPASAWLTARLGQLRRTVFDGSALACTHLAGGPRIVVTALWEPGVLVCAPCAGQLRPNQAEEFTCDRCRDQVTDIHPRVATHGLLLVMYGLCEPCRHSEEVTARKSATRPRPMRRNRPRR